MEPHPDYATIAFPRDFALEQTLFTPLSPDFVDEDLEAVQKTAPLLTGIFGNWPEGLTRESNLIDLAWHEREFTARRSFSWIIRDQTGAYIGCFYLFPELGCRGKTTAALWLCDIADRNRIAQDLHQNLTRWLTKVLPPEITLTWKTRPALDP